MFNATNKIMPFRFWCQKVIPLVYDDSLSYYELLCKVVNHMNEIGEATNNISEGFTQLVEWVEHYFDSHDFQEMVNEKLDEMAEDGTLARLINEQIFGELNERVELQEKAPYQYQPDRDEKYRERVRKNLASWLEADYLSTSFEGNEKGKTYSGKYGGYRYTFDGYMKAPIGSFDYGVHRTVKDKYSENEYDISTMGMDCCTFTSLITKGYNFDDSIYKDGVLDMPYNRERAVEQATFIYNEDRNDYIGYDGNNNITTHEFAEGLYYSGAKFLPISYKEYGSAVEVNTEMISQLETGDLIFIGLGNARRENQFYGIHHNAIYVRNLEEIDQYLTDGRKLRISDVQAATRYTGHTEWGYIVHVLNDGREINGINVLRVDTLEWAMYQVPQYDGGELCHWGRVWGVKVQPNTLNSAGGFEGSTSIRNSWGKMRVTDWADKSTNFTIRTGNGGVQSGSIGSSGVRVSYNQNNPVDFNTLLENGDYKFTYIGPEVNINRPCNMYGVLHVRNNSVIDMYPDTDVSTLPLLVQEYEAMTNQYYYRIQRHVKTSGSPRQFTQWYLVSTNDPRGTDISQYPENFILECETQLKPIVKKYF